MKTILYFSYGSNMSSRRLMERGKRQFWMLNYEFWITDATLNPYNWYKEHVLRGARENNLPHDYISIIEKIESLPDPDMDRHEQELAIYI